MTSKQVPLITIGMAVYNAADTVERAIQSAQEQTWPHLEIVVVDDASRDDTVEIVQDLSVSKKNVRVFFHERNRGVAAVRNTIIDKANGEFIVFFDDDDTSDPTRLEQQYRRLTAYEQSFAKGAPVICHTARIQTFPDGHKRYEPTMGMTKDKPAPHGPDVALRVLTGKHVPGAYGSLATCSQMARTSLYRDLGGFDEAFLRAEDTDLSVRAALNGGHFVGVREPLVKQTMTLTDDKGVALERQSALQLLDKYKDIIDREDSYAFCRRWLSAKYDYLAGRKFAFLCAMIRLFVTCPVRTIKRVLLALPNRQHNRAMKRYLVSDGVTS